MDKRKPSDIIIQALVSRIQELETVTPGTVSDPMAVVEKLIARGEVEYVPCYEDPLAQRTFRLTK